MSSYRQERLRKLLHRAVGEIIAKSVPLPEALATVSGVELSKTQEHATVRVTVFPFEKSAEVLEELNRHIGAVQRELNEKLRLHPVPKIRFEIDESEERGGETRDVLDRL